MGKSKTTSEKEAVVVAWLKERYIEYKQLLLQLLGQQTSESTILTLLMRMLKAEGSNPGSSAYNFPANFMKDILQTLLCMHDGTDICREFGESYLEENDDLRFYAFQSLDKLFGEGKIPASATTIDNAITILSSVETVPEGQEEIEDFYVLKPPKSTHSLYSVSNHKKHAQNAWLTVMRTEMTKDQRKILLGLMSTVIAPWFMQPELLMDFLTDSYDAGGSTSLLALSGVFYLIQERNLDYPLFYRKLYSLLDTGILHSKHRSKFLRLLDTFMSSTHLPAVMVASFIKRLARLALFAPPAAIVAIIPWIYNLLKKHPSCTFMIHREVRTEDAKALLEEEGMDDPFMAEEKDPMETNAIESSLWELIMLQSHYHPNVATLAKIISEQFTKHSYNLEDFLDHSYGSVCTFSFVLTCGLVADISQMLEGELAKEVKKEPVIEFEIPKKIFMKQDVDSGVADSLLVKLWDFN
jgi:U3 small nucleolar RNA-associated protein 19